MSSSVSKILRLTRASMIAAPKRSIAFRGDEFKEREEAFESQYVKQKERDDLKRMAEKKKQEETKKAGSQPTPNASTSTNNSKAAKIKEVEDKISKLQKELADLKK
ncbi:hypothetical protein ACTFIY_010109 [Dictyostelium cf. discoideum]